MVMNTVGKNIYPGRIVEIGYNGNEDFHSHINSREHFKIVMCNAGSGIININGSTTSFISPAVFCFSERENIEIVKVNDVKAVSFYFHPKIVNAKFDFDNIRKSDSGFSLTENQDIYWIYPFIDRENRKFVSFSLGPNTNMRMIALAEKVQNELERQGDWFWPCRSRSFFIEILFILQGLHSDPGSASHELKYEDKTGELMDIILYLNTNYEKKITISDITKTFGTNRTSLSEKFNRIIGLSVMEYLSKLRIQVSAIMLRDTMLPVSEIMYRVGFNDSAHFGRVFKKITGFSPSDYRKEYCGLIKE